jgi:hypothetical protein
MMDFGSRISNSWEITKSCFRVLGQEKMLVLYPIISMLATGIIMLTFYGVIFWSFLNASKLPEPSTTLYVIMCVLIYLMYFFLYLVSIFSNVAIVGCAKMRLEGKDPVFSDGLKIGFSRLWAIIGWALVAATVGILLNMLRGRGRGTNLAALLIGMAWNVITYFVIPVIAVENVGPFTAISRSMSILRKVWGEALFANFGIGMIMGFVMLFVILLFVVLFMVALSLKSMIIVIAVIAVGVLTLIILGAITTALKGILMAALYRYAQTGEVGYGFSEYQLDNMFSTRSRRGGGMFGGGGF